MELSKKWPFRQDNPDWADCEMWHRPTIIETLVSKNKWTEDEASEWIRKFKGDRPDKPGKNNIGNEGCLITSLAMILVLLGSKKFQNKTPEYLNKFAMEKLYYSRSGISLVPLYADIILEITEGAVQLAAKEEYSWSPKESKTTMSNSTIAKKYLCSAENIRKNYALMIKIGTYDDAVASHYLLIDPDKQDLTDNPKVLDPAMPLESKKTIWTLSDSYRQICKDPDIKKKILKEGVDETTIRGIWLFAKWENSSSESLLEPFFKS